MNDVQGRNEAYSILWAEKAPTGEAPAWDGPAPSVELPADSPVEPAASRGGEDSRSLSAQFSANDPAWAAAAGAPTAAELSQERPDNGGFGWDAHSGASRFSPPDAADHAPRQSEPFPSEAEPASATDPHHSARSAIRPDSGMAQSGPPVSDAQQPYGTPDAGGPAPASYASAPSAGQSGVGTDQGGSDSYRSAPPQVVGHHDDLPEDALSIGRSRSNSIVLDDMLVSRRHVLITADEEGLLLRDLGSRNGTFVNGRRVEQTHLHEGDRIGIGASTFEVRDGWLVSV